MEVVDWLNGHPPSDGKDAVKSDISELLSVTDAAVQALQKSRSSSRSSASASGKHPLSPNNPPLVSASDSKHGSQPGGFFHCADPWRDSNYSQDSSVQSFHSKSTTASDVLIRSTLMDTSHSEKPASDAASLHNSSVLSRSSNQSTLSGASSTFLTGQAKAVKVSSKKLKEIKSPFHEEEVTSKKPSLEDSNVSSHGSGIITVPSSATDKRQRYTKVSGGVAVNSKKNITVERHFDQSLTGTEPKQTDIPMGKQKNGVSPRRDDTGGKDDKTSEARPMMDSGYMTQNIQVIRELQQEIRDGVAQQSESGDSMIQTIGQVTESSDASTCTQPDIVTVPETIVTVNAKDVLEGGSEKDHSVTTESSTVSDADQARAQLSQRFNKFHPPSLKQGNLTHNASLTSTLSQPTKEEVKVSQFSLSQKQKLLKSDFLKKHQTSGSSAVKRVVQPKLVHPIDRSSEKQQQQQQQQTTTDAATTAAVAAASAVAATQPFLRAQHEMESRMAEILERLSALPKSGGPSAPGPQDPESRAKIQELEHQVKELTQHRLDHLEQVQRQQFKLQAQLLAISRDRPPADHQVLPSAEYYDATKPLHFVAPDKPRYQKAISQTVLPSEERASAVKFKNAEKEGSTGMLDTPAPRRKPPTPTAYNSDTSQSRSEVTPEKKPRKGTLLAEILASQEETPQNSPFPNTPPNSRESSYTRIRNELSPTSQATVREAHQLVQELGSLKNQMQHTLADANQWKEGLQKTAPSRYAVTTDHPLPAEKNRFEVAPLDVYMQQTKDVPPVSPYPVLKGKAAVSTEQGKYRDAEDTLKRVQTTRNFLEANLDLILKGRHDSDVYSFIDQLTRDSTLVEKLRIKQMVDEHIKSMNADLEREVFDELLKLEQKQKDQLGFLIPERDVSGPKVKGKPGFKGKGKVEARINTGLRKPKEKEVVQPPKKTKKPAKSRNLLENETYMKRVYGKAAFQAQRNTQKEPYLRYQSLPKSQLPQPGATKAVQVKGVEMSTHRTQTTPDPTQMITAAREHYYFDPATGVGQPLPGGVSGHPVQGQLIPMAIPLGAPRKETGLPPPSALPSSPQHPVTSTPLHHGGKAPPRVGLVTVRDEELDEPTPRGILVKKPVPKLSTQVLPPVNIDSVIRSPTATTSSMSKVTVRARSPLTPRAAPTDTADSEEEDQNRQIVGVDEYSLTEEEEEEDGTGIALPGFKPHPSHYHGPEFPPQAPPLVPEETSSDVLAADLRQRDLLQNKAVDWVEQELMARLISEYYANRPEDTIPHAAPTPVKPRAELDSELSESISEASPHDSLIAETLGQDGVQFFVDAGQPVDEKLVNSLIKEVILEKVRSMVGQPTSADTEQLQQQRPVSPVSPRPRPRQSPRHYPARQLESPPMIPSSPVPTPEPTPKSTPVHSPPRRVSPPPTPELTPVVSEAGEPRVDVAAVVTEMTESDEVTLGGESPAVVALPRDSEEDEVPESFASRHDVYTPTHTPPRSPPADMRTPSPSVREEPAPVEVVQPPAPREPTPPASPKPWADPGSPLPEDNPEFEESESGKLEMSEEVTSPPASPVVQPVTPPLRERRISDSTVETSPLSSQMSDTVNEQFSEGQWLLSVISEGEVPGYQIDPDLEGRLRHHLLHPRQYREEGDDTLHGTESLAEEEISHNHSEGEVLHPRGMAPDADPVLAIVAKMQKRAASPGMEYPLPYDPRQVVAPGVDKSLGEVSVGQRPRMDPAAETAVLGERAGSGEELEPVSESVEDEPVGARRTDGADLRTEVPTSDPLALSQSSPSVIMVQPRTPTPEGDSYKRTGGRRGHPTLGPPVATTTPSSRPQTRRGPSYGRGRPPYSPGSSAAYEDDRLLGATGDSQNGFGATGTVSDMGTRTMTPDQMNVEALLQSRDYFTNTQSDAETTGEFGQSRNMAQSSLDFSQSQTLTQSMKKSTEFGQGNRLAYSLGTTSDMSLPPELAGTLDRTGGLGQSERVTYTLESSSDFRLSERYADSLEGTGDFGQTLGSTGGQRRGYPSSRDSLDAPRQVSVTIPSVVDEDSESGDGNLSEISLGGY